MSAHFPELQSELAYSLRRLDAAQTQLRPPKRPDSWSIQQIVEHLLLTWSSTELALDGRLTKQTPTKARSTAWHRAAQFTVLRLGYMPPGREAPEAVTPPSHTYPLPGAELMDAAADHLDRLGLLCDEVESLFGAEIPCASHLALGPLTPMQWRRFHLVHGRHHIRHIMAIRRSQGVQPV